jgi:hypothetical protein
MMALVMARAEAQSPLRVLGQSGRATRGLRSPWVRWERFPSPTAAKFKRRRCQALFPGAWLDVGRQFEQRRGRNRWGAQAGALTIDPNAFFGGVGTFTGNIVDNGFVGATDGGGFQGNGALTINGSVSGSGQLSIGAQETLALNGSVNLSGSNASVYFYGGYGTLAIGNAAGFSSAY